MLRHYLSVRNGPAFPRVNGATLETIGSPILWAGFLGFVLVMLALDLGVFHRKAHEVSLKEAAIWSGVWVAFAALFGFGIWHFFGGERALEFATGYVIEKALSVDNLFVFVAVFSTFAIPSALQHRVLFWGILGALVMRAIFILVGGALLAQFHWVMYVFGGILLFTAVKLFVQREEKPEPEKNPVTKLFRRFVPSTSGLRGSKFLVRENGRLLATPLLLVLVLVEVTDLVFAVDSIPAIFAVTQDPFLVFTSNIFAILGLRSLYFLLAGVVDRFHYLKPALALVLAFVGTKMVIVDLYKVPVGLSLGVIVGLLAGAVVLSFLRPPKAPALPAAE
jgi:tellurite resistance protein TerC